MEKYIIKITDARRGQMYLEKLSFFGFPHETAEKEKAYKYTNKETANRHAAVLNQNLRFCYQQNAVPAEKQTFYNVETVHETEFIFFVTVEIVVTDETAKDTFSQYKHVCNKFREKFTGTFEDAREYIKTIFSQTPGYLRRAEIESLKDGICGPCFVRELSWDPNYTNRYTK